MGWLNGLIMNALKSGLLNVPAPILSRVFQQTEKAIVEYNQVLEVMTIPFPYPYAQTCYVLLVLMGVATPFAMCSWTTHPATTGLLTFTGVMCLSSLELIARQLENPFGEDSNDLPIMDFQEAINETLLLMLTPDACDVPELTFSPEPESFSKQKQGPGLGYVKVTAGHVLTEDCIQTLNLKPTYPLDEVCVHTITLPGQIQQVKALA